MTDIRYTEGVWGDGAAILLDGQPLAIHLIVEGLNERDALRERLANAEAALASERRVADEVEADLTEALEVVRRADIEHRAKELWRYYKRRDVYEWGVIAAVATLLDDLRAFLAKHGAKQ